MFQELEEISADKLKIARLRLDLRRYIREDWRTFVRTYAIEAIDDEHEERLAKVLGQAVNLMSRAIREPHRVAIVFGRRPYFAVDVGVGAELYVVNMEAERSLASADDKRIYVDAFEIFPEKNPMSSARKVLVEELIHAWMLLKDEDATAWVLERLHTSGYVTAAITETDEVIAACENAQ